MAAGYQDLFINQAETYVETINLSDINNLPYDLSGFTVLSCIKKSYYSSVTLSFDASIVDHNYGVIQLAASGEQTANIAPGKFVYDVLLIDKDGSTTRVLEGQVFVSPAVTFKN